MEIVKSLTKPELLPCPFCGSEARFIPYTKNDGGFVYCSNKKCCLGQSTTLVNSEEWNKRYKNK